MVNTVKNSGPTKLKKLKNDKFIFYLRLWNVCGTGQVSYDHIYLDYVIFFRPVNWDVALSFSSIGLIWCKWQREQFGPNKP